MEETSSADTDTDTDTEDVDLVQPETDPATGEFKLKYKLFQ